MNTLSTNNSSFGISIIVICVMSAIHFLYRQLDLKRTYEQKLRTTLKEEKKAVLKMNNLASQLNQHFIFNSLNTLDAYIMQDRIKASDLLNKIAALIRMRLCFSKKDTIRISNELRMLNAYMAIENERFEGKFNYNLFIHPDVKTNMLLIFPFLIQQIVEKVLWEGISKFRIPVDLDVEFRSINKEMVCCTIEAKSKQKIKSHSDELGSEFINPIQKIISERNEINNNRLILGFNHQVKKSNCTNGFKLYLYISTDIE